MMAFVAPCDSIQNPMLFLVIVDQARQICEDLEQDRQQE